MRALVDEALGEGAEEKMVIDYTKPTNANRSIAVYLVATVEATEQEAIETKLLALGKVRAMSATEVAAQKQKDAAHKVIAFSVSMQCGLVRDAGRREIGVGIELS